MGVLLSVAVLYGGIAVALVQSTTAAEAVGWGSVIAVAGISVGLLLDLNLSVRGASRAADIFLGQGEALRQYEDLRRTQGAVRLQAIWSARYPRGELDSYFAAERADLERSRELRVERLVCSDVISVEDRCILAEKASTLDRLVLWQTEPLVLECNICEYLFDRSSYLRAIVVLGGADKAAQVAIRIDTREAPELLGVVLALRGWFESLPREPL
jgi:hypothetical protein